MSRTARTPASHIEVGVRRTPKVIPIPRRLLDGAVGNLGLKEKPTVTRVYEWGSFAYTTYGWGSYAWQLYRDPAMVHMVAKGVMTAGSWAMWLLV